MRQFNSNTIIDNGYNPAHHMCPTTTVQTKEKKKKLFNLISEFWKLTLILEIWSDMFFFIT